MAVLGLRCCTWVFSSCGEWELLCCRAQASHCGGFSSVKVLVAQSCPTLCDPMNCSPSGSYVHGILQARILEWVAMPFSRGSSWPRNQTRVSCISGRFFTVWATSEAFQLNDLEQIFCPLLAFVCLALSAVPTHKAGQQGSSVHGHGITSHTAKPFQPSRIAPGRINAFQVPQCRVRWLLSLLRI